MRYRLFLLFTLILAAFGTVSTAFAQSSLETYTSQDGTISLQYPHGWTVTEGQGRIQLSSSELTSGPLYPFHSGQAVLSFRIVRRGDEILQGLLLEGDSLVEMLQGYVNAVDEAPHGNTTLDDASEITIGEHHAAFSTGTITPSGNEVEEILIDFEIGSYALIDIVAAPGELARVEPKVHSIAATITYTPVVSSSPTTVDLATLPAITTENASTVKLLSSFSAHSASVNTVAISPDGKMIASGGDDGAIYLWDAATGEQKTSPPIQDGNVVMLLFTPDGHSLITGADDGTIAVWNPETGEQQKTIREDGAIWYLVISPDSQNLAFISYVQTKTELVSSTIWLWDLKSDAPQTVEVYPSDFFANSLSFSPDGQQLLYSAGTNNQIIVKLYDVSKGEISRWSEQGTPIDVFFTADAIPMLSKNPGDQTFDVQLVNLKTDDVQFTLSGHTDEVFQTILNSPRTILGMPSFDNTTTLWNIQTGDLLATLRQNDRAVGIAFSPDGRWLVTSDAGGKIYLWGVSANT